MKNFITALLPALALLAAPLQAQRDIPLQENAPDRYIVQKGDTLWGIAAKFLKQPWRWPEIWNLNKEQIANPHRIYPGDVIVLERRPAGPQLSLGPTVKLSPQVRSSPLEADAIPPIPPRMIEPFLSQPLVIDPGGLDKAPRIIATQENRVNLGAGGIAYVTGMGSDTGGVWQIYRTGPALIDPDTRQTLGFEAKYLGTGRITSGGSPATLQIVSSKEEISTGDRLVATGTPAVHQYIPRAPDRAVQGRIIAIYGGVSTGEGGRHSIISLNRGRRDGIESGHVLALHRGAVLVPDPQAEVSRDSAPLIPLPPERYGLAFVFRTFDAVSYALVMEAARPVSPGDLVRSP
ncbi:MAG: LysM peptidoglycan-binding domain-containing protein [Burkholderiales bacterium]|nr:LysM peptidoglycan-binding domain-containing protein [Burkholderiales bacterium]